jgi:hypothetical protein
MRRTLRTLLTDTHALAAVEFALSLPILLTLGLLGLDTANYVITHMRISQVALHVADNASRVGELNVLVARTVHESDINDVMLGAARYAGGLDLAANGRIILSSLERNAQGGQWIHLQRCFGAKNHPSSYGVAGNGATGTALAGMGAPGDRITASSGDAVMFVEVAYDYQSISPFSMLQGNEIVYTGSYVVRDPRDLSGIYQNNPAVAVARCS